MSPENARIASLVKEKPVEESPHASLIQETLAKARRSQKEYQKHRERFMEACGHDKKVLEQGHIFDYLVARLHLDQVAHSQ